VLQKGSTIIMRRHAASVLAARRAALSLAAALLLTSARGAPAAAAAAAAVTATIDGAPAQLGAFSFPQHHRVVLDNGLFTATFDRDDAASGWPDVSISLTGLVVGGVELAHNLDGAAGDRDRAHSFYIDAAGGASRLVCSSVHVLRLGADLVELAFVDNSSAPLQHSHHVVVRAGVAGIYGFDHLTAVAATTVSDVRMVARFDRSVLTRTYSDERGALEQQPTSAFLALMPPAGAPAQHAWTVNGTNAPGLPVPDSNGGNLPKGSVYSDYSFAVTYADNVLFGHVGDNRGAFHVQLSGSSGATSAAGFGRGPRVQGLAARRDAVLENAFVPSAAFSAGAGRAVDAGFSQLYGPWLTLFASGADAASVVAAARAVALAEINASRPGLDWMQHRLYAGPANRSTVVGFVEPNDGRNYKRFVALLAAGCDEPEDGRDIYSITTPTYWATSDLLGKFTIVGVPQGSNYTLYLFAAPPPPPLPVPAQYLSPSDTDVWLQRGVGALAGGGYTILGSLGFTPSDADSVRIWRVGFVDFAGGEFGRGNLSRSFDLGNDVPANLTFHCDTFDGSGAVIRGSLGQDPDTSWPYAMTHAGGTFLLTFMGGHTFIGDIRLKLSLSMVSAGASVAATINGVAFAGDVQPGVDDPLAQQAITGARAQLAVLTAPATLIVPGLNNVTLTLRAGSIGFDSVIFDVVPGGQ
jgi:rhamnogalacturonan endolyase